MRFSRPFHAASTLAFGLIFSAKIALAEKTLLRSGETEVFTDGRVGAFLSYIRGDALPRPTLDATGNVRYTIDGGGFDAVAERHLLGPNGQITQGTLEGVRFRSGLTGNLLGIGVRGTLEGAAVTAYIQFISTIQGPGRKMNQPNPVDVRQGYGKVQGWWGSLLAGRSRSLFSRGATDIDALYGHGYGVGFPADIDFGGPSLGHIGFGIIGAGEASGLVYETPLVGGLQLAGGLYDPVQVEGAWRRTKWPRPEAELTFERPIADIGKVVLFGNGAYEDLHGQDSSARTSMWGVGYGGRLELGPVRLGAAGHYGKGVGLDYAFETDDATFDLGSALRSFDGSYLQSQLVLGSVDISAGWGITRVHLSPTDKLVGPNGYPPHSIIKRQIGLSAGVVYHVRPWLHLDVDFFRADAAWFLGERQVVNVANSGLTFTW